jgi:hypothetical protein
VIAGLVARAYPMEDRDALVLASIVSAAAIGGSDSWGRGDADRATVEAVTTAAIQGAIRAVARRPSAGSAAPDVDRAQG